MGRPVLKVARVLATCGLRKISQPYCGVQKCVLRNMWKKLMLFRFEYPA
jgi:hypothetical protein